MEVLNPNSRNSLDSIISLFTKLILIFLIIVFAFREIYSPDIGFHLRAGEWIIQNQKVPEQDPFTYTSSSNEYIDMHWLYQVILALINRAIGEFGIVAFHIVLILLSFYILLVRIKNLSGKNNNLYFLLSILSISFSFETRPHILSWLIFNLFLLILEEYDRGNTKHLLLLPLLMLIWVNTHVLFILGWVVIGCYIIGIAYRDRKLWTPLTKYAIICILVSFMNPYFFKGITLPFIQFQLLQPQNVFKSSIAELASPLSLDCYFYNGRFILIQPLFWFHLFLLISIISFVKQLRTIQLHTLILFGLFLYLALSSIRNIPFFVIAILPLTIDGFKRKENISVVAKISSLNKLKSLLNLENEKVLAKTKNLFVMIVASILILAVVTDTYYINYRSNERFGYRFNKNILPVKAVKFLNDHKLEGKILNHFNYGGFLIYALPQKIFIDGRTEVMGERFFYKYSILWNQIDKSEIIQKYNPDIIIFPHQNDFLWIHYLKKDSLWRLVYVDELSAIYLKSNYAENIPIFDDDLVLKEYEIIDSTKIDNVLQRKFSGTLPLFTFKKQYFPLKELGLSTFYYYNDQFDEAIRVGLHGILRSTVVCPEIYYNLGHYFFEKRDFGRSAYCYERFLQTNDDNLARERLKMIRSGRIKIWEDK